MQAKSILILGLLLSGMAGICGLAEAVFFGGRVNEAGVVEQSLFLPLAFIFAAMAITAFVFAILRVFLK